MLPQPYRLPGHRHPQVLNSSLSYHQSLFTLKLTSNSLPHSRLGFIISKKISSSAVTRQRLKRLFRQAVRPYLPRLQPGHDLLFLAKKPLLHQSLSQLQAAVKSVFQSAKLLHETPGS